MCLSDKHRLKIFYLAMSISIGFGFFAMSHTSFADDAASFAKINATYNSTANILEITGLVYKTFSQNYVLTVFNPQGQLMMASQMRLSSDDTFSQHISPTNALWSAGNYTVKIASGPQVLGEKSFYFPGISCCMQNPQGIQANMSKTTSVIYSPLKQFKSGIASKDVKCKEGLQFIMKNENGQPACVTPHTFDELVTRGWGIIPLGGLPTDHNMPTGVTILYNGTQLSDNVVFYVKQGQNMTLMLDVTSNPVNVPVTLYTESHNGFTKTNGIDFKLSDTMVNTPAKVMLNISVSKDATPSTYGAIVKENDTDGGSVTYRFFVTVK